MKTTTHLIKHTIRGNEVYCCEHIAYLDPNDRHVDLDMFHEVNCHICIRNYYIEHLKSYEYKTQLEKEIEELKNRIHVLENKLYNR